jgi:Cd2+/Zn2+-exporting ATPase
VGEGGAPSGTGDAADNAAVRELLAYAAVAEQLSEHPLARAVTDAARAAGAPAVAATQLAGLTEHFEGIAGKGVAARVPVSVAAGRDERDAARPVEVLVGRPELLVERGVDWPEPAQEALAGLAAAGQTPLAVAVDGRAAGVIGVADVPRPEARAAVQALRAAGVQRIVLLTGDRDGPAQAVAREVGIAPADVHAGLLPEQKVEWIKSLRQSGHRVAMVGDGVNDAPALAAADVAIAMGAAGTDLALAAADVALMTDDVRQAAAAVVLSRRTVGTIRQNLVFAAVWNAAAVAVAAIGVVGPAGGALVHNLGSVAVVVNAARLVNTRLR